MYVFHIPCITAAAAVGDDDDEADDDDDDDNNKNSNNNATYATQHANTSQAKGKTMPKTYSSPCFFLTASRVFAVRPWDA